MSHGHDHVHCVGVNNDSRVKSGCAYELVSVVNVFSCVMFICMQFSIRMTLDVGIYV